MDNDFEKYSTLSITNINKMKRNGYNMKLYTVLDLETTGLDPQKEQITQISAIKYTEKGVEVGRFSTYVTLTNGRKPSKYSPHVTEELCATGMDEETAVLFLDQFINGSIMVIQYAPFDLGFLHWKHPDGDSIENFYDFICTRTLSKVAFPEENPSLGPTAERLGIENPKHHDAINDCKVTWKVFKKVKSKVRYPKSVGFKHWHNTAMRFEGREMTYVPYGAKIVEESDLK